MDPNGNFVDHNVSNVSILLKNVQYSQATVNNSISGVLFDQKVYNSDIAYAVRFQNGTITTIDNRRLLLGNNYRLSLPKKDFLHENFALKFNRIDYNMKLLTKDLNRFKITCTYSSGPGMKSATLNPLCYEAAIAARCCISGNGFRLQGQFDTPAMVPSMISTHRWAGEGEDPVPSNGNVDDFFDQMKPVKEVLFYLGDGCPLVSHADMKAFVLMNRHMFKVSQLWFWNNRTFLRAGSGGFDNGKWNNDEEDIELGLWERQVEILRARDQASWEIEQRELQYQQSLNNAVLTPASNMQQL